MASFDDYLARSIETLTAMRNRLDPGHLDRAIDVIAGALLDEKPLLICGNGGSAADSMHIAGELVGRFLKERRALKAIALSADPAVLTAWANDIGYEGTFSRQVEAYGEHGGVLLAISTSGNSTNVVAAAEAARSIRCKVIALTGKDGGALAQVADLVLRSPSRVVARVQEVHDVCIHALAQSLEASVIG